MQPCLQVNVNDMPGAIEWPEKTLALPCMFAAHKERPGGTGGTYELGHKPSSSIWLQLCIYRLAKNSFFAGTMSAPH